VNDSPAPRHDARPLAITGRVLIDRTVIDEGMVLLAGDKILDAGPCGAFETPSNARHVDMPDRIISPGFIDLHIHGSGGCYAEDDPLGMARHVTSGGCTYFLPTLMTNNLTSMVESARTVQAATGPVSDGATVGGVHLEGPFLNPRYGAQRPEFVLEARPDTVEMLLEASGPALAMVTVAPEQPGAIAAIERFAATGALVALGHSDAAPAHYAAARTAGATHVTHLFNAMQPHREPDEQGYDGVKRVGLEELALIDDDLTADIVCDSSAAHIADTVVKLALRCKGEAKLSLITDAMFAAGLPPGTHQMRDGQQLTTAAGEDVARLTGGWLCGSVMSMSGAVRNLMNAAAVPIDTALVMATEAPARALGIFDRKGSLDRGKDADVAVLDTHGNVEFTVVEGRLVYSTADGWPQ
jgi:N-acetylglucosamine-6-phosphate deacetylase